MNSKRKYYYQMIACLSKQCWSELQALFAEKMQKTEQYFPTRRSRHLRNSRRVRPIPPHLFSGSDPIWSLSLSSEAEEDGSVFFFSSIRNQFPLPGMDGERKGPPRENKSHFSLSLHIRREEKMPPSSISPLGKSTRTLQCFCVVQQRVWEPFNYFPLFLSPTRGGQREGVIVDTTRGIHVGASVRCHDVYVGRACNSNNCPESIGGGGECSGRVFNDVLTCQCLPTFIRT